MDTAGQDRTPFPWQQVMAIAFGRLCMTPDAFWSMTPREFAAALTSLGDMGFVAAMSTSSLHDLMTKFPD